MWLPRHYISPGRTDSAATPASCQNSLALLLLPAPPPPETYYPTLSLLQPGSPLCNHRPLPLSFCCVCSLSLSILALHQSLTLVRTSRARLVCRLFLKRRDVSAFTASTCPLLCSGRRTDLGRTAKTIPDTASIPPHCVRTSCSSTSTAADSTLIHESQAQTL